MNHWNSLFIKRATVAVKAIISAVCIFGSAGLLVSLSACTAVSSDTDFGISHLNPDTMVDPTAFGYSQVVTVNNGRTIYLAGQGPTKLNEKSPEDLRGQAANAVDNIFLALDAAGAGPENIVYLRINVVDYNPKMLLDIAPELQRLTPEGAAPPASVFVGVASLVLPSTKIEIETVAAIP
jgi:enamine deaminase RidA (YjgF/YER057c/UK114 family)